MQRQRFRDSTPLDPSHSCVGRMKLAVILSPSESFCIYFYRYSWAGVVLWTLLLCSLRSFSSLYASTCFSGFNRGQWPLKLNGEREKTFPGQRSGPATHAEACCRSGKSASKQWVHWLDTDFLTPGNMCLIFNTMSVILFSYICVMLMLITCLLCVCLHMLMDHIMTAHTYCNCCTANFNFLFANFAWCCFSHNVLARVAQVHRVYYFL